MPEKSPIERFAVALGDAAREAADDPVGAATRAAHQARGVLALGFMVVGQVSQTIATRLMETPDPPAPSAPKPPATQAPAKKAPAKKPPAKKAPAKKAPASTNDAPDPEL